MALASYLRLTAVSFFALAAWVTVDAVRTLLGAEEAEPLPVDDIDIAATSVVVMPLLVVAVTVREGTEAWRRCGHGRRRGPVRSGEAGSA